MTLFFVFAALIAALAVFAGLYAYRKGGGARPIASLAAGGVLCVSAFGIYMAIGRPDLPDQPYAARIDALKQRPIESYTEGEMLARLAAEARANPTDARPHIATGILYAELGRDQEAARAFQAALRRDPNSALAMLNLGRALVRIDQGRVGPDALNVFAAAAAAAPDDPTPWLYQALAATQDGRRADAARLWAEVKARLAPDDPRQAMAARMIAENER